MPEYLMGLDKPSLDEVLEHHGVKGQRWGVRRAASALGKAIDEANKKAAVRDEAIKTARVAHPQLKANLKNVKKDARLQYKVDKQKVGRAQAKLILHQHGKVNIAQARKDYYDNMSVAQQELSKERTQRIVRQILTSPR